MRKMNEMHQKGKLFHFSVFSNGLLEGCEIGLSQDGLQ